jgi:hypothetical protein
MDGKEEREKEREKERERTDSNRAKYRWGSELAQ